jgi:hypothetical protein
MMKDVFTMERGRPARRKTHEAGETPVLQCAFTLIIARQKEQRYFIFSPFS